MNVEFNRSTALFLIFAWRVECYALKMSMSSVFGMCVKI